MKLTTLTTLVASLLASAPVFAAGYHYDARGTSSWHQGAGFRRDVRPVDPDPQFLVNAHQAALEEIQLARLAMTRAADPEVRSYAQRILEDDTALDRLVTQRAAEIGVFMPVAVPSCADLDGLRGASFEVAFLQRSMDAHDAIRAEFADYKAMTGGALHQQISCAFDRLVEDREIAKPLHDRIRNQARQRRPRGWERGRDRDRDRDDYRS